MTKTEVNCHKAKTQQKKTADADRSCLSKSPQTAVMMPNEKRIAAGEQIFESVPHWTFDSFIDLAFIIL